MLASWEFPKIPSDFDMTLFFNFPGSMGSSQNFPKCWQVGNFLNSVWKFQVFGVLETAVKPCSPFISNLTLQFFSNSRLSLSSNLQSTASILYQYQTFHLLLSPIQLFYSSLQPQNLILLLSNLTLVFPAASLLQPYPYLSLTPPTSYPVIKFHIFR